MDVLLTFKIFLAIVVPVTISYGLECDSNGVSCINCTDYQQCSGGAPTGPIFSYKNGMDCSEQLLLEHCWTKLNCYDLNECTGVGIFPDAMVDSNYFVCLPDPVSGFIKFEFTCPEDEFFDQNTLTCVSRAITLETTLSTISSSTAETTTPAPTSSPAPETTTPISTSSPTSETTTPAPTSSPIPETTTPAPTSSPTPETTTPAPTSSPTTESSTTTPPTIIPTISPPAFACSAPGIFPNPTNCKMYFRCSTSLRVFNYTCPGMSYFNENTLKCSLILTPACKEQILQNTTTTTIAPTTSTTTPAPTTTTTTPASTTTTTTLAPTTTNTSPPTQAPTTPFSCSVAGTFENPLDCKTYYRCSSSGATFLYVCPNNSYYNELTKRCGLTITPKCRSKLKG